MPDEIYVQIRFETEVDGKGVLRDAILVPKEEYEVLSDSDIQTMKQERVANWVAALEFVPDPVPELTNDELQEQIDILTAQVEELSSKIKGD